MDEEEETKTVMAAPCSSRTSTDGAPPGTIRKRRFSTVKIQPTRIKKVMQADEEIGRMVASVPVAIGRAMEHFAEKLLETAAHATACSTSKTLSPQHIKMAMERTSHFQFLAPLLGEIPTAGSSRPTGGNTISSNNGSLLISKRRLSKQASSGNSAQLEQKDPTEKPKRGRPRKMKKIDKCVDEDEIDGGKDKLERALMPPPPLPFFSTSSSAPSSSIFSSL